MLCPHCGKEIVLKGDPSAVERLIELYYRTRAQGKRITLKDISNISGYSESHLKRVKRTYDAAGKWGAKKKKEAN